MGKKQIKVWAALAVVLAAAALLWTWTGRVAEASEAAHAAVADGALLLDVRTPEEFAAGHLPGAVNIPVDELEARVAELGGTDRSVVVYCRSGKRSARAEQILKEKGFRQIVDLGPMAAW